MANHYDVGDLVRVSASFTNPNSSNAALDPTTVSISHKDPSGNVTTISSTVTSVVNSTVGAYYHDIDIDQSGTWSYRWLSTGTGQAAEENEFVIDALKTST